MVNQDDESIEDIDPQIRQAWALEAIGRLLKDLNNQLGSMNQTFEDIRVKLYKK